MKPALKTLEPADSAAALSFLAPREFRCIALVSSFMRNGTFAVPDPSAGEAVALISETGAIDGIVFISSIGFVFHCSAKTSETRYAPLLKDGCRGKRSFNPDAIRYGMAGKAHAESSPANFNIG